MAVPLLLLAGCTPPGPRALLAGKRLLEEGRYEEAVERLQTATTLMVTNADAWNYLGVACQSANQPAAAVNAYQRALLLNHDLTEAHYNLGCLWTEQGRWDFAKSEFTAVTLTRPSYVDGWLKLGSAQLHTARTDPRSGDLAAAEKSFTEALHLSPHSADAYNGLGLAQMQHNHPREAAQYFNGALTLQTNYAPALLNLAVLDQTYYNNKSQALERYRAFLALAPNDPNVPAVQNAVRILDQEIAASTRPPVATAPTASTPNIESAKPVVSEPPPETHTAPVSKPEPQTNFARTTPPPAPPITEVVHATPEPEIHSTPAATVQPQPAMTVAQSNPPAVVAPAASAPAAAAESTPAAQQKKRGFFERINPLNLFRSKPKSTTEPTPLPADHDSTPHTMAAATSAPPTVASTSTTPASAPVAAAHTPGEPESAPSANPEIPRYAYHTITPPAAGDRQAAEGAFTAGTLAQKSNHLAMAIADYRRATQTDPTYFEAYYNLGLACGASGDLPGALVAYETALAIKPASVSERYVESARYNFALALTRANYPLDAANELEKNLAANPGDAASHLALANLCAQQLGQPARARQHYLRVLQLDPHNRQAANIRDWLAANPG